MDAWSGIGRFLIVVGLALAAVGTILMLTEKWPGLGSLLGWVGRLPGDLSITRERFSLYAPIATSLVLSILLSLLVYILSWLFRR
ncbi:MAG TPA: DUF2905 domain-containing protein [Nitrospira sp.]|jgi:hypothetical protein|nr:DUF2905 domain-containing protein [Nitrospira sp.]MBS0172749.1 DUF2905 domain-containing protein [Nitrospira sp.]MBS0179085.1 DUF2905 domain-containing protein [Nitrospira sp.]MBX3338394.1 DUF2905 domain-containing protein [Nitrospira sp.]MCW5781515.1 DUF2905 domain-containing protein [Nitrospira sp.]